MTTQALLDAAYKHATDAAPIQLEKHLSPFAVARAGFLAGAEWRAAQATQQVGDVKEIVELIGNIANRPDIREVQERQTRMIIAYGLARAAEAYDQVTNHFKNLSAQTNSEFSRDVMAKVAEISMALKAENGVG